MVLPEYSAPDEDTPAFHTIVRLLLTTDEQLIIDGIVMMREVEEIVLFLVRIFLLLLMRARVSVLLASRYVVSDVEVRVLAVIV